MDDTDSTDTMTTPLYRHRFVARGYDALNALLWLPGGSRRLRRQFVDTMRIPRTATVAELGCGTGLVTRHLVGTGATVTAVDRATHMLAAVQRRAPQASVVVGDITTVDLDGTFDWVVLAFVLHELAPVERVAVLHRAVHWLAPGGRIAVLEWARPPAALPGRLWTTMIRTIEPSVAHDIIDAGLDRAIAASGLIAAADFRLATGRARAIHLRPTDCPE